MIPDNFKRAFWSSVVHRPCPSRCSSFCCKFAFCCLKLWTDSSFLLAVFFISLIWCNYLSSFRDWACGIMQLLSWMLCLNSLYHWYIFYIVLSLYLCNYRWGIWNFIEDCLLCTIFLQAVSNGMYIDWCLEMLVKHFVPPIYLFDFLKETNGIEKKNKVLSRVHAALEQISDLVPLAPLRLSPIVVQKMPKSCKMSEPVSFIWTSSKMVDATVCCTGYYSTSWICCFSCNDMSK